MRIYKSETSAALFLLISLAFSSTVVTSARPCEVAYRCSDMEDVVWATDGEGCYVFRNQCLLLSENCQRQNRFLEVLKTVTKEECQQLCRPICTADYTPVCAAYNGVRRTFSNACALSAHVCLTGETYNFLHQGACEGNSI